MVEMKAYCMKCKKMMPMVDGKTTTMKNGRKMMKGKCEKCGTGMCKIM
jgi:methionyl-tRNA synthetase